jgi:hypothetical protein
MEKCVHRTQIRPLPAKVNRGITPISKIKERTCYHKVSKIQSNLCMWSPLLSSHLDLKVIFSCPFIKDFIWIKPLLSDHLSYKATFYLSHRWPLNTGLTKIWPLNPGDCLIEVTTYTSLTVFYLLCGSMSFL